MPVLKNPKHERFAQLVSQGVTPTSAAKTVGYSELRAAPTGSELVRKGNVKERIEELRVRISDQTVSSVAVTKAWVIEKLVQNAQRTGTMVTIKALELIGKELGMFVDRKDMTLRAARLEDVPQDDLIEITKQAGLYIEGTVDTSPSSVQ
jgi:hypothetical protein